MAAFAPADVESVAEPVVAVAVETSGPIQTKPALDALRVCGDVLATGAEASGAFVQAELLRTIHGCRSAGLYRLAPPPTPVLRSIPPLRAAKPEVSPRVLAPPPRHPPPIAYQPAPAPA